jgi:hypothetical protein
MWISEIYNPETHDTYREEVDKWYQLFFLFCFN